jgi:hypothetical protein
MLCSRLSLPKYHGVDVHLFSLLRQRLKGAVDTDPSEEGYPNIVTTFIMAKR